MTDDGCRNREPTPPRRLHPSSVIRHMSTRIEVARSGVSLGAALAIAISWSVNKSVLWAILHGILSWLYVIYYIIVR